MKFYLFISMSLMLFGGAPANASPEQNNAGKTIMALGTVKALASDSERSLRRRAPVFLQDTVYTEQASKTQLRMVDGGMLSLKELTQLDIASYDFNPESEQASILLSLIKGGLRTVTGQLDSKNSSYQLKTPVASIGVRGTDYSAQMVEQDLLLAVWQGAIDVAVAVGKDPTTFSLGQDHEYSFAKVKANGEVEFFLKVPKTITLGHTTELVPDATPAADIIASQQESEPAVGGFSYHDPFVVAANDYDQISDEWVDAGFSYGDVMSPSDGISRTGTATFGLLMHSFISSVGDLQNASMSMTVDFDQSRIPTGQLSFFDSEGEWFAVFNGVINQTGLDININFASHGNEIADGDISAVFIENGTQVFGDLFLIENDNSSINAGGTFLLGETQQ